MLDKRLSIRANSFDLLMLNELAKQYKRPSSEVARMLIHREALRLGVFMPETAVCPTPSQELAVPQ